jgi:hypothetical protein
MPKTIAMMLLKKYEELNFKRVLGINEDCHYSIRFGNRFYYFYFSKKDEKSVFLDGNKIDMHELSKCLHADNPGV